MTSDVQERNPWKRTGTREIYRNPWITVREDSVIRPDGKPGIYGVVDCRIATGVVALDDDNNLYLVGQYRYPTDCYSWEIIEGGSEDGESALSAAKRELEEEAGIAAEHWEALGGEYHLSNCHSSERAYLFLARGLRQVEKRPDDTEILQVRRVPFADAVRMVDEGKIFDALSVLGILRAARHLEGASGK